MNNDFVPAIPRDPALSCPRRSPQVQAWVRELNVLWAAVGMSMTRFAARHPIDKGTVSRYLSGHRVPRDPWFLDTLLAALAEQGRAVSQPVRDHLIQLQLDALQAANPHEYKVRVVSDELVLAEVGRREAERYAHTLEEQLADLNRQIRELTDEKGRLRAAWDADYGAMQADHQRLKQEIDEITAQLHQARERTAQAEQHCRLLDDVLGRLDTPAATDRENTSVPAGTGELQIAQLAMARGTTFGWITSVGPGFQITAPSRTICQLLDLSYEDLDGSYLLADPLRSRLQTMLGNFGEWALIIGMLTHSALDGWRADPSYPHCAEKVTDFFDWLGQYVSDNYQDVARQVERAPIRLVDGDSSRNDLRQCLAAATGNAEWPPYNTNRHNSMRMHVVNHPLLAGKVARFEKTAIPIYRGNQVIGYEVIWNAEHFNEVASQLLRSVLAEFGIEGEDPAEAV